jgi:ABC-type polysaccharide/polyol phosphate transport system ATPase subunit
MNNRVPGGPDRSVNAIEVRDLSKTYRRYGRRAQFGTLKSALLTGRVFRDLVPDQRFDAVKGVSFAVPAGTTFGVIGRNGSGKSTLLKLLAGIGKPTSGDIAVRGRSSALIELGAGFHPEISGRDNIFINGMMLGLAKREIAARFDEIVAFAELEDFIDAPVKTYSSGMYVRLGFAVAINVDPDVLLVDEVLSVGDEAFTHKCLEKFAEFKRKGKTIVLVTHSLDLVTRFCDRALWLDAGRVRGEGDPKRVIDAYLMDVARGENEALAVAAPMKTTGEAPEDLSKAAEGRWGSREVEITAVEMRNARGEIAHVFESGEAVEFRLRVRARQPVTDFVFGVGIFNAAGICCYGTNTRLEGAVPTELSGDGVASFIVERLDLVEGAYKLDVAVHRDNGVPYDYHRLLHPFRITARVKDTGICRPPHRWAFSGDIRISGLS